MATSIIFSEKRHSGMLCRQLDKWSLMFCIDQWPNIQLVYLATIFMAYWFQFAFILRNPREEGIERKKKKADGKKREGKKSKGKAEKGNEKKCRRQGKKMEERKSYYTGNYFSHFETCVVS